MSEMVEKVARALCLKHVERGLAADWTASLRRGPVSEAEYAREVDRRWIDHADDARAAIAAMEVPTGGMVWAGELAAFAARKKDEAQRLKDGEGPNISSTPIDVWTAMVLAALKEQT